MNPQFVMSSVDVLEYTKRPYINKKGEQVEYVSVLLRVDGKVLRFSASKSLSDLTGQVGESGEAMFELTTWGDDLNPRVVIVGFK